MSCECTKGLSGMRTGLGQIDPVTISLLNDAFVHAKDLWNDLMELFGIGAGAREADVITPLQDQITQTVLVPIAEMSENPEEHTCAEFQQGLAAVNAAETQFKTFLATQEWKDGRAADQALWWLTGTQGTPNNQEPWFKIIKTDFLEAMAAKNCTIGGGIITNPDGSYNWPIIGLGAGVLYMIARKK